MSYSLKVFLSKIVHFCCDGPSSPLPLRFHHLLYYVADGPAPTGFRRNVVAHGLNLVGAIGGAGAQQGRAGQNFQVGQVVAHVEDVAFVEGITSEETEVGVHLLVGGATHEHITIFNFQKFEPFPNAILITRRYNGHRKAGFDSLLDAVAIADIERPKLFAGSKCINAPVS